MIQIPGPWKPYTAAVVVLVAILGLAKCASDHDRADHARLHSTQDSLHTSEAQHAATQQVRQQEREIRDAEALGYQRRIDLLGKQQHAERLVVRVLTDTIRLHTDTVGRVLLDSLVAGFDRQLGVRDSVIVWTQRELALARLTIADQDSTIRELRGAVAGWIRQSNAWQKKAEPGLFSLHVFTDLKRDAQIVAVTCLAVKLLGKGSCL